MGLGVSVPLLPNRKRNNRHCSAWAARIVLVNQGRLEAFWVAAVAWVEAYGLQMPPLAGVGMEALMAPLKASKRKMMMNLMLSATTSLRLKKKRSKEHRHSHRHYGVRLPTSVAKKKMTTKS